MDEMMEIVNTMASAAGVEYEAINRMLNALTVEQLLTLQGNLGARAKRKLREERLKK